MSFVRARLNDALLNFTFASMCNSFFFRLFVRSVGRSFVFLSRPLCAVFGFGQIFCCVLFLFLSCVSLFFPLYALSVCSAMNIPFLCMYIGTFAQPFQCDPFRPSSNSKIVFLCCHCFYSRRGYGRYCCCCCCGPCHLGAFDTLQFSYACIWNMVFRAHFRQRKMTRLLYLLNVCKTERMIRTKIKVKTEKKWKETYTAVQCNVAK